MYRIVYVYVGGGVNLPSLAYAAESTPAESPSFIGRIFDYFMIAVKFVLDIFYYVWLGMQWLYWAVGDFVKWCRDVFGKGTDYVLGFLGFSTITALLGKICSKTLVEMLSSRAKKFAEAAWGTYFAKEKSEPEAVEPVKRRDLTRNEITGLTLRYGYVLGGDGNKGAVRVPDEDEVYTTWTYTGWTWYGVTFCKYGVYTCRGLFSSEYESLSYDELRNSPEINMTYLKNKFKEFPEEFYNILMELREID